MSEDTKYLDRVEGVTYDPVFIIGPHRSGTTILNEILLETRRFNYMTAFHVVNSPRLLALHFENRMQAARDEMIAEFKAKGLEDRGFDGISIGPDVAEEYCFIFEYQGRRPILSERNLPSFDLFCRKMQLIQDPNKPLLLKNPFDALNFMEIERLVPNARFVFIFRDPIEIINSQINAIRSIIMEKNEYVAMVNRRYKLFYDSPTKVALARRLYGPGSPLLFYQTSRYIARNCDYTVENYKKLGNKAVGLSYDELCDHPNESIQKVLDFVGVDAPAGKDYSEDIKRRPKKLLPRVEAAQNAIRERNKLYYETFGVDLPAVHG